MSDTTNSPVTKPLTGDKLTIHNLEEKLGAEHSDAFVGKAVRAMLNGSTLLIPLTPGVATKLFRHDLTPEERAKLG